MLQIESAEVSSRRVGGRVCVVLSSLNAFSRPVRIQVCGALTERCMFVRVVRRTIVLGCLVVNRLVSRFGALIALCRMWNRGLGVSCVLCVVPSVGLQQLPRSLMLMIC